MSEIILQTERLILRRLMKRDFSSFVEYRTDPEIMKYQSWESNFTPEWFEEFIHEQKLISLGTINKWVQVGIERKSDSKLIGDCALHVFQEFQAEFGVTISKSYQKKGYAYEAIFKVFNYCFKELKLHRITGLADVDNDSSIKLQKKLGMRKEAHYEKSYYDRRMKEWRDEYRYAILASEWSK
ncbi:MAG: GNAT family N-acetyltransferase [Candidatus Hodarchaeales archaeon]|jgi:aminoglycoside 6'-N-acetyltransferase